MAYRERRMEREYGFSLLACFEVIRLRWVLQQASGLRHTRAPPVGIEWPTASAAWSASMALAYTPVSR